MGVVLNEAHKFGQWMEMYCMLLCNTGQRSGAVISLRWKDVDLDGRCIYFSANRKSRQKCVADVAMNDDLYEYMMANRVLDGEKLVVAQNGRRPMSLNYQWRKLMVAAGLPTTITPHIIRHSVATNLVSSGVPILRVSKLLGHSSSVITEKVYAKFTPEFTKETVNAIRINGNSDRPRA
jgi:integrase